MSRCYECAEIEGYCTCPPTQGEIDSWKEKLTPEIRTALLTSIEEKVKGLPSHTIWSQEPELGVPLSGEGVIVLDRADVLAIVEGMK